MIRNFRCLHTIIIGLCLSVLSCTNPVKDLTEVDSFIQQMAAKQGFEQDLLTDLFDKVEIKQDIIQKISKPSESLPWYKYRKIFLKESRIKAGVQFWRENAQTLASIEKKTGVPAPIIVAILGVETFYGQHTGHYRVIDALSTLAFSYPPRSPFFRKELENFLLLCRDGNIDPLTPIGSYAGAMGMPQFMPSSYISYAIDYNNDNYRDIWHNPNDTIASIGNYLAKHGWKKGENVAFKIRDERHKSSQIPSFLKENLSFIKFNALNPNISRPLLSTQKAKIFAFEQENGEELWALSDNFYVITRYNKSPLYAMAVYQLSLAISNQYSTLSFSSSYEKNHHSASYTGTGRVFEQSVKD